MNIVDSHIHFWDITNGYNDWVKDTNLPKLVTPENLEASAFVHIEAHSEKFDPLCEYNWLKSKFNNSNIKVVAFVDFTLEISQFEKKIIYLSEHNNIVAYAKLCQKRINQNIVHLKNVYLKI